MNDFPPVMISRQW